MMTITQWQGSAGASKTLNTSAVQCGDQGQWQWPAPGAAPPLNIPLRNPRPAPPPAPAAHCTGQRDGFIHSDEH